MGRFVKFLLVNLSALGLVGWLQWSLFDVDGLRTNFSQWTSRSGLRTHKRIRPRRADAARPTLINSENDPWNG